MRRARPRAKAKKTSRKKQEDPEPDDPILNPGQTPPPAPVPPPAPAPVEDAADAVDDNWLTQLARTDPGAAAHIRDLRAESKKHRMSAKAYKEQLSTTQAERDALATAQRAAQETDLAAKQHWKELHDLKDQDVTNLQRTAVDYKLESAILSAGIAPEYIESAMRLVDRTGLTVSKDGKVGGVETAIERFKEKNAALLPAMMGQKMQQPTQQDPTLQPGHKSPENALDWMTKPGTNMTYAQYRNMMQGKDPSLAAGAGDLPAAGQQRQAPVNLRKGAASKEQVQEYWEKTILKGQKK